jgi:hypothetical protein
LSLDSLHQRTSILGARGAIRDSNFVRNENQAGAHSAWNMEKKFQIEAPRVDGLETASQNSISEQHLRH